MSYKKTIFILCLGAFLSSERSVNAQTTVTFNYVSNTAQSWTVPACVPQVTVELWGAGGGSGNAYGPYDSYGYKCGGPGAYYKAVLTGLTSGNVLTLYVPSAGQVLDNDNEDYDFNGLAAGGWPGGGAGGWGGEYYYGGGGGGYAGVAINGTYYVVAGGGGGGGGYCCEQDNWGGGGGDSSGGGAPGGGYEIYCCNYNYGYTAQGGSCSAGGAACSYDGYGYYGTPGGSLQGGAGGPTAVGDWDYEGAGGGGGGGYYGGGGGADGEEGIIAGSGGGGGSSFPCSSSFTSGGITATRITNTAGVAGNNASNYPAPGGADATIGFGGYNVTGGNGRIVILYTSDSIGPNSITIGKIDSIKCNGANTAKICAFANGLPGVSAFTYTWLPSGGSTDTATGLVAGVYTVNVSNMCGNSASASITITQPSFFAPNPTINAPLCNGDTGSIIGGAIGGTLPYTFVFTPGGQVPAIYGVTSGTYSLNVLDNRGCATSKLITVSQPAVVVANASEIAAPNCYGTNTGIAIVSVTGGIYPYAYAWSPSGGTNLTASNLAAGNYAVTVTDANGCVQTASVAVTQPAYLGVIVNPPLLNLACNGDNNGVLGSGVSGGIRPYTYFWSNGLGIDTDVMNLSAGTYSLTVTDAHGCVTIDSAMVIQPAPMNATIQSTLDDGHCTGSAWVVLSGGTPSYNYLWSAGSVTFYQSDLCAGESYCCTITDANGCQYNTCTIIQSSLGVGNISGGDSKIKVYPNPNNGQFTVEMSQNGNMTIEVYNVLGEKVYTQMSNGNSQMTIDMSSKPNGVYLYRVISNENGNIAGEGKIDIQR